MRTVIFPPHAHKFIGGRAAHFCRGDGWSDAEAHGRNEKTAASIRVSNYQ